MWDYCKMQSCNQSIANNPGILTADIATDGSGAATIPQWPNTLPSGTILYIAGVGYSGTGATFGDITDTVMKVVQ